jgi:hypothetical protein
MGRVNHRDLLSVRCSERQERRVSKPNRLASKIPFLPCIEQRAINKSGGIGHTTATVTCAGT